MEKSKIRISSISNLEADIMLIIWDSGRVTVREVHEAILKKEYDIKENGFIPYTTVMSTINNLTKKKILNYDKSRKIYIYWANVNRKELANSIIKSVTDKLL
jgi:predicted transcriptional regulator